MKLENLSEAAHDKIDLADPLFYYRILSMADLVIKSEPDKVDEIIKNTRENSGPLELKLALKLYSSRTWILRNNAPLKIAIVFAMWGEHNRLRPRTPQNPNGEDLLNNKLRQLDWAFKNTYFDWKLLAIDDGCPYGSGEIAKNIIQAHPLKHRVEVLFLRDHLPDPSGPLRDLDSAEQSRKGGSIILGSHEAIKNGYEVIVYTDADNSVHLGQIGLLLKPFHPKTCQVVLGDRKHENSVVVKQEDRWGIGIKLLRHMQRMVGSSIYAQGIYDTQAAFKLFEANLLSKVIENPSVFDFSFDSDWIASVISMQKPFCRIPFAFIDSFAESSSITQGPMSTWETLLLGLVKSVRNRGIDHNEEMARVLEEEIRSASDLEVWINHLPSQLENIPDSLLGDPEIMSPQEIRNWIKTRKKPE